ncbi:unnamed protein product [Pleuronectes platessa]|uniref:Uncharacterized protein n=1 Tax=Pleuronectes platessa TaxID=8262 RepID=A0A9N7YN94_PLEPL|nr:unnamed protein product [Pleuronectes platessa]
MNNAAGESPVRCVHNNTEISGVFRQEMVKRAEWWRPHQQSTWWGCAVANLLALCNCSKPPEERPGPTGQTIRLQEALGPPLPPNPNPHHFPPRPHESKSPSSPCQLTAGGKRGAWPRGVQEGLGGLKCGVC